MLPREGGTVLAGELQHRLALPLRQRDQMSYAVSAIATGSRRRTTADAGHAVSLAVVTLAVPLSLPAFPRIPGRGPVRMGSRRSSAVASAWAARRGEPGASGRWGPVIVVVFVALAGAGAPDGPLRRDRRWGLRRRRLGRHGGRLAAGFVRRLLLGCAAPAGRLGRRLRSRGRDRAVCVTGCGGEDVRRRRRLATAAGCDGEGAGAGVGVGEEREPGRRLRRGRCPQPCAGRITCGARCGTCLATVTRTTGTVAPRRGMVRTGRLGHASQERERRGKRSSDQGGGNLDDRDRAGTDGERRRRTLRLRRALRAHERARQRERARRRDEQRRLRRSTLPSTPTHPPHRSPFFPSIDVPSLTL